MFDEQLEQWLLIKPLLCVNIEKEKSLPNYTISETTHLFKDFNTQFKMVMNNI